MPITVDQAVNDVVGSLAGKLSAVGLSVLRDHTNPDVIGAIRKALGYVSLVPAAFVPVDADLAPMTGWNIEKFLDAARLETLYKILGAGAFYDQKIDTEEKYLSQLRQDIQAEITLLEDRIKKPYGPNVVKSAVGAPPVSFIPNDPFAGCRSYTSWWTWPYPT